MRLYFGSVRFFKHLILTVTALLIIVPTVLCILLAVDNGKKSDEIDRLNSQLSAQSQVSQTSDDQSRTSSATESSDNVKAEPSVTESAKPETSAASSSAVESTDSSVSSGADNYTSLFPTLYADMKIDGNIKGNVETTKNITINGKVVGDLTCDNISMKNSAVQGNVRLKGQAVMANDLDADRRPFITGGTAQR